MVRPVLTTLFAVALVAGCGATTTPEPEQAERSDPLDSVSAEELFRRGRLLTDAGDHIRAEQYISAAIQRGYPEERALPALMQACLAASRLVAALQYAEPYLARHPDHWALRVLVASIHMGLDHAGRARDELLQVLRDAPEEPPQAHYFLGVLYRDSLDDPARAAEHFARYLALEPEGEHRAEAAAGVAGESGPRLPQRVPMPAEGHEAPQTAPPPAAEPPPQNSTGDESEAP